jgi:hypothetical protein
MGPPVYLLHVQDVIKAIEKVNNLIKKTAEIANKTLWNQ